jgi:AcrR family transcriptional regulator
MPVVTQCTARPVGRPKCFDEEKALDQAMRVFWRKGFEGASIIDLTQAMDIKPASLYSAFGNKQELFRRALELYREQQLPSLREALKEPTAYAVAERVLRESAIFLTRPDFPHRCLTVQTCAASHEGAMIHNELITLRNDAQQALKRRFERARRKGDLPREASPESLARFIATVYQGMNIQAINGATRKQLLDLAQTALRAWPKD